jgi:hypothetical protein
MGILGGSSADEPLFSPRWAMHQSPSDNNTTKQHILSICEPLNFAWQKRPLVEKNAFAYNFYSKGEVATLLMDTEIVLSLSVGTLVSLCLREARKD